LNHLGVGRDLSVKRFTAANVANELRGLLRPEVRQRCQEVATRLVNVTPFEKACTLIEEMANRPLGALPNATVIVRDDRSTVRLTRPF
jgi:hypothetical protein